MTWFYLFLTESLGYLSVAHYLLEDGLSTGVHGTKETKWWSLESSSISVIYFL